MRYECEFFSFSVHKLIASQAFYSLMIYLTVYDRREAGKFKSRDDSTREDENKEKEKEKS